MKQLRQLASRGKHVFSAILALGVSGLVVHQTQANPVYSMSDFANTPISIVENDVAPQVQINASNDHQLFFKAYNDYSDLDDDGIPETTYKNSVEYYGYFDSYKCYSYDIADGYFKPEALAPDRYCTPGNGYWSGNFLNWASMTRIDAVRKILFGGHRRVDTTYKTILERAHIPTDIHAFAKYYQGGDLSMLTPFTGVELNKMWLSRLSNDYQDPEEGSKVFNISEPESFGQPGDYVFIEDTTLGGQNMLGTISSVNDGSGTVTVEVRHSAATLGASSWRLTNYSRPQEYTGNTSKSSISIPTTVPVSKTFEVANASEWNAADDYIHIVDTSNPANYMHGKVSGVSGESLTVTISAYGGSGTIDSWSISNVTGKQSNSTETINTGVNSLVNNAFAVADVADWNKIGDYVTIVSHDDSSVTIKGWINAIDTTAGTLSLNVEKVTNYSGTNPFISSNWGVINHTRPGITLCNVTYASSGFSEDVTDANPPLIRVAEGNYSFWSAGEVRQCVWEEEDPGGDRGKNYNDPELSGIYAAQDDPWKNDAAGDDTGVRGVGLGSVVDYVAKVEACVDLDGDGDLDSDDGRETCKEYLTGQYKPIGLLQEYSGGSRQLINFGMIAGTYGKSTRGGDMIMPLFMKNGAPSGMCREINQGKDCDGDGTIDDLDDGVNHVAGDGTFSNVYSWVGGPASKQDAEGLINAWSIYRIKGYEYGAWNYNSNSGDKCPLSVDFFGNTSTSECTNWGNPFAEIYLTALRQWVGENAPQDYQASDNDKGVFQGLNYLNGVWEDPLDTGNYCAPLYVINFNSSVISADTAFVKQEDELDTSNQGMEKDFNSPYSAVELTNQIGQAEGIYDSGKTWFIGETKADGSKTCTAKSITNLGEARGLCPEGPGLSGGYLIAGMSWYAHTNDIRPDDLGAGNGLKGSQTVDSFSVRLASGSPIIDIPVPGSADQKVTILPSCINNDKNNYGCTLVDFKIIKPHKEELKGGVLTGSGKFLAIWEDSLQGNDYDLDAGGIYEYEITSSQITVTTAVTLRNLGHSIGHGYVISGTEKDGLHIHSGVNGFEYNDPVPGVIDCPSSDTCSMSDGPTSQTYVLGESTGELLEDPLWYAAKWGGFEDKNDNKLPDLQEEWDEENNKTGELIPDGIPDNYFYASHPQELKDALTRTLDAILERKSSGTAAAVVSSNVRGEGALYQAYYQPLLKDGDDKANWVGTVQALWLDRFGYTRQDCGGETNGTSTENPRGYNPNTGECVSPTLECVPNGRLDNYCVDQVVETFYDTLEERTRVKVFQSTSPDEFESISMQGVVQSYGSGNVTMVPNSIEATVTTATSTNLDIAPYFIEGTVDSYDSATGDVTMTVSSSAGPTSGAYDQWIVENQTLLANGKSSSSVSFGNSTISFAVDPVGTWIALGDTLRLETKNAIGRLGERFTNWEVECLAGTTATGDLYGTSIKIDNSSSESFVVAADSGSDFSTCTRVKLSTYNMRGQEGDSLDEWSVTNLDTLLGKSSSHTSMTLANTGAKSFTVANTLGWLVPGDRVLVSNYETTVIEIDDTGHLWNAREKLYLPGATMAQLQYNRSYPIDSASTGRYITTWVDADLDGVVDSGEYRDFDRDMFSSGVNYGFFDVANLAEAQDVVDYVRGVEVSGTRNRTVKYQSTDTVKNVMRLGDVVNSTPTIVGTPQEGFDLLYDDGTFRTFRRQYQDRRVVVYTGGNDGLLHAFNGGFYNEVTVNGQRRIEYSVDSPDPDVTVINHPLGSELWAYAPYNLLSHLQWLKDPLYAGSHVSFIDSKPRVFDANIFTADTTHPDGWGTVMVVGMRLGGGTMEVDTLDDDDTGGGTGDNVELRSAYIVFDITDPEQPPVLLGEIPIPDGSFTTVYPAVSAFRDVGNEANCSGGTAACNSWYLIFGTGPNNLFTYQSNQTAKVYLFDLAQLITGNPAPSTGTPVPSGCTLDDMATGAYKVITCDTAFTGMTNSFVGNPTVVDWDLDFYADTSYFGLVGTSSANTGSVIRFAFNDDEEPSFWNGVEHFYKTDKPVVVQPVPAYDDKGNKWIFFGTGRYFQTPDKISTAEQSLFGLKDYETGTALNASPTVDPLDVMNTSDIEVFSDGYLETPVVGLSTNTINTFNQLKSEIDNYTDGWQMDLPPIYGTLGTDPATRNVTNSALLGGVLFSTVFQPSTDPCEGEGNSRLYALFYKTGTAFPSPSILSSTIVSDNDEIKYRSNKFVDLGTGFATSPSIHSGSGTGGEGVKVFSQLSTGDIVQTSAGTVESVRTGRTSWGQK